MNDILVEEGIFLSKYDEFVLNLSKDPKCKGEFDNLIKTLYLADTYNLFGSTLEVIKDNPSLMKDRDNRNGLILILVIGDIKDNILASSADITYRILYKYVANVITGEE